MQMGVKCQPFTINRVNIVIIKNVLILIIIHYQFIIMTQNIM